MLHEKYQSKVELTAKYPALVIFENGKIVNVLQETEKEKLTISKTKQFIEFNKIGD